jgi:hypothetical protein
MLQLFKITALYLVFAGTLLTPAKADDLGGEVENGGDSVFCNVGGENNLVGYFSLDYLLTYRLRNNNADVVDRSWEASQARISGLLREKFPALGHSFDEFVSLVFSTDTAKERLWNEASFGLEDISDERILRKLPPNCLRRNSAGTPEVLQSVIRVSRPESTVFEYDYEILEELQRNAPLQFSFLMVHEWLWDFTSDVNIIRDVNRLIHSNQLEQFRTSDEAMTAFENLGISLLRPKALPICLRSDPIKAEIERLSLKSCENIINVAVMDAEIPFGTGPQGYRLDIRSRNLQAIKLRDFSGLAHAETVLLSGNRLTKLEAFNFAGLIGAKYLQLQDNVITKIEAKAINSLQRLYEIELQNNDIDTLESSAFYDLANLVRIDLSNNKLRTIPADFLRAIRVKYDVATFSLDLRHNLIDTIPDGLCDGVEMGRWGIKIYVGGNEAFPYTPAQLRSMAPCIDFSFTL